MLIVTLLRNRKTLISLALIVVIGIALLLGSGSVGDLIDALEENEARPEQVVPAAPKPTPAPVEDGDTGADNDTEMEPASEPTPLPEKPEMTPETEPDTGEDTVTAPVEEAPADEEAAPSG